MPRKTRQYSESTAREVDGEVESLLSQAFSRAMEILRENREAMDRLAENLVENEEIPGGHVYELLGQK